MNATDKVGIRRLEILVVIVGNKRAKGIRIIRRRSGIARYRVYIRRIVDIIVRIISIKRLDSILIISDRKKIVGVYRRRSRLKAL